MTRLSTFVAATALVLGTTSGATAKIVTITRTGSIYAPITNPIINPNDVSHAGGVAVGDKITETITFDSSEVGPLQPGPTASPDRLLTNPNFTGVALGSGNSANSLTLTVGPDTVTLVD